MQRLYALLILAWALIRTVFTHMVGATPGIATFRRNYAADRLPPVAPEERRLLPTWSGCIACGLCDVGEGVRAAAARGSYAGAMDLMLATSRSMPDYDAAALSFAHVSDERLEQLEARCPTAVPMRQIAAFVRKKASELDG
jgi:succinate dehydrogenase/fumarate reductase-like Fe-S protein